LCLFIYSGNGLLQEEEEEDDEKEDDEKEDAIVYLPKRASLWRKSFLKKYTKEHIHEITMWDVHKSFRVTMMLLSTNKPTLERIIHKVDKNYMYAIL
jgi:hypothetical protein